MVLWKIFKIYVIKFGKLKGFAYIGGYEVKYKI